MKVKLVKVHDNTDVTNQEPLVKKIAGICYGFDKDSSPEAASLFITKHIIEGGHWSLLRHHSWTIKLGRFWLEQNLLFMPDELRRFLNIHWEDGPLRDVCEVNTTIHTWYKFYNWVNQYGSDGAKGVNDLEITPLKMMFPTLFGPWDCKESSVRSIRRAPQYTGYTFKVTGASRGYTHEQVRHSFDTNYTQRSTRYVNEDGFNVVYPPLEYMCLEDKENCHDIMFKVIQGIKRAYQEAVELGVKPQDARQILPIGIHSDIYVTVSARELEHLKALRVDGATGKPHWEIKSVVSEMLKLVEEL